ncbi:Heparan sulfate glucosamine 3-O-sulfotransferase 3B1 [Holothuria leucospilota]|uniref:Heparan sulfate glucosamine 3-O-sulfotransferase 3B1 n=1 Tax=Holothuria leucospilota TaxID=206669 RepID=A0A9Q0YFF5_HOLLE|nr:Heparan sulfate glucosamine 3-O-sulfotransferase 3B1 [Holothuria leucospilota]
MVVLLSVSMVALKSYRSHTDRSEIIINQPLIKDKTVEQSRMTPRKKSNSFLLDEMGNEMSVIENHLFDLDDSSSFVSSFDESSFEESSFEDSDGSDYLLNVSSMIFSVNKSSNLFQHGCYMRGTIKGKKKLLPKEKLEELGCSQRPPKAIVFGVKKAGTTTLKEFLAFHPDVSVAPKELKFLNTNSLAKQGLAKYASLMPYSLPGQIPIEKTPGYLVRWKCAGNLKRMIPDCKLIAILNDPVHRAISDYVHLRYVEENRIGGASELSPKHANKVPHYEAKSTFEESVLYPNGSIKVWNTLLDTGLYYKHAKFWLDYFPAENFLYLDANDLIHSPVQSLREIEKFLGLRTFFSDDIFHFNESKGFYCVRYPLYSCMPSGKGRPHPDVDEDVIKQLQEYFEPYNKMFSQLVNKTFSWTTYSENFIS